MDTSYTTTPTYTTYMDTSSTVNPSYTASTNNDPYAYSLGYVPAPSDDAVSIDPVTIATVPVIAHQGEDHAQDTWTPSVPIGYQHKEETIIVGTNSNTWSPTHDFDQEHNDETIMLGTNSNTWTPSGNTDQAWKITLSDLLSNQIKFISIKIKYL